MNNIAISGYIGHPQLAKKNNTTQYFFLNGRNINSKQLSFAVFSAMEHLLERGLKPLFVLNIALDYKSVDVNVHPQKSEVKFEDEQLIYSIVKRGVQNALQINTIMADLSVKNNFDKSNFDKNNFDKNNFDKINIINEKGENENIIVNKNTGEIHSESSVGPLRYEKLVSKMNEQLPPKYNKTAENYSASNYSFQKNNSLPKNNNQLSKSIDLLYSNKNLPSHFEASSDTKTIHNKEKQISTNPADANNDDINTENLWQYHNKYILLQTETGLLAIDQHNAHERIIYEKLIADIENKTALKQGLLFEVAIRLNSMQMLIMEEIENDLKNLGFEFEIKNNSVIISSQPAEINIGAIENSFLEIIDDYNSNEELKHIPRQERIIATISCKGAIKAGQNLSSTEMKNIVSNLFRCKMQYVCPHGRPILVSFPISDWDKKFGRL
jgi:DNA mismatch repair protein MutL